VIVRLSVEGDEPVEGLAELSDWLHLESELRGLAQPRRSDVRIVVTSPDGRRVELDAKRVGDVEQLLRQTLGEPG
jgi:hypothetical protein